MTGRLSTPLRVAAVSATTALLGVMCAFPAVAADGDVQVVNTETVQVYTDATGAIDTKRIYEQLAMTGNGSVDLRNPIETDGLRNLEGFGGFDVEEGQQVTSMDVDGKESLRTVSNYGGDLPLDVSVRYFLDGEPVEPGDVVGESGELEVRFTVKNVTGAQQEVTFDDGNGGTVTKTVEVPIPMVGSLTTVAPSNFTDVASSEANMAGDGKGGTKLSFTMTLFPPIGSDTAEFGYTAQITDGVIPRASISALPVNPLESPSFKTAGESYKGGAETGVELTDGAGQIDANLLKLRDGAAELLAGLIQLRDGAVKLEAGLAGEAAPGAQRLASGASELAGGIGQIDDGAGQLASGAGELSAGAGRLGAGVGKLDDGAGELNTGAKQLSAGTKKLAAGTGDLNKGAKKLDRGAKRLSAGAGELSAGLSQAGASAPALLDGLEQVQDGLLLVDGGLTTMYDGIGGLPAKAQPIHDGIRQLLTGLGSKGTPNTLIWGVDQVRTKLAAAIPGLDRMIGGVSCADQVLADLVAGVGPIAPDTNPCYPDGLPGLTALDLADPADQVRYAVIEKLRASLAGTADAEATSLLEGLSLMKSQIGSLDPKDPGAVAALASIECGLDNTALNGESFGGVPLTAMCKTDAAGQRSPGLLQGVNLVGGGVSQLVSGVVQQVQEGVGSTTDTPDDETLRGGINGLQAGVGEIQAGGETLLEGMAKLAEGAGQLDAGALELALGTGTLSKGTGDLNSGAKELNTGAGKLAAGVGVLKRGTGQLRAGSGELVDGAGRLSAGASKLAAGTGTAADGANQLSDGANQLATGLGDAANGSGQLATGLRKAADGAPALRDGAQQLSDEGTSKLVEAGQSTAQNYGEMYATLEAGAERAQNEDMVYGAPEGAVGLAAYSYEIKGEDGESGRNVARGLGGAAVIAAGAGAFALRRRFI